MRSEGDEEVAVLVRVGASSRSRCRAGVRLAVANLLGDTSWQVSGEA